MAVMILGPCRHFRDKIRAIHLGQTKSMSHRILIGLISASGILGFLRFGTDNRFQCLLPVANTPMIEYTLEFLANAGVQEVFLYGGAHSDKLEKYIKYVKEKLVLVLSQGALYSHSGF